MLHCTEEPKEFDNLVNAFADSWKYTQETEEAIQVYQT